MENRNYVIDRLKSKTMSIDEFNFERLIAPPISSMFTPMDIMELNKIATSLKYSAQPEVKFKLIDNIMRRRGFVKFIGGTNRIAYRPIEDDTFLIKVAIDAVGINDNPREFRNQFIFKPFVTKVFEITPCGTLGVFERVVPITSREEFISMAESIFEVINKWFVGEYILEDFGSNFFMNWGIRKGFGPVLLDFPYVYKLDGNKLFCNAPSNNTPTGKCEGVIDYDPGFNFLYCTKCGVKYKAKELSEAIKENKIISKSVEGDISMKLKISGGSTNANRTISTGTEYVGMAKTLPRKNNSGMVVRTNNDKRKEVINPVETPKVQEEIKKAPEDIIPKYHAVKEESKPTETVVIDSEADKAVVEKPKVTSPIDFDPSLIKHECEPAEKAVVVTAKTEDKIDIVKEVISLIDSAALLLESATDEERSTITSYFTEAFKDILPTINESKSDDRSDSCENEEPATYAKFITTLNKAQNIFNDIDDVEEELSEGDIEFTLKRFPKFFKDMLIKLLMKEDYKIILNASNPYYYRDEDDDTNNCVVIEISADIVDKEESDKDSLYSSDIVNFGLAPEYMKESFFEAGYDIVPVLDNFINEDAASYGPSRYYAAKIIDIKDIYADEESSEVLVIVNEKGNYLTIGKDNELIAVDMIGEKAISALEVVSKEWFESMKKIVTPVAPPVGVLPPSEGDCEVDPAKLSDGLAAEIKTVNGVPVED